jgi:bacillithiol synthase
MHAEKISFADVHAFSSFFLDYIQGQDKLKPFYNHFPKPENFSAQLREKSSFPRDQRTILVETLQHQYRALKPKDPVDQNILALANQKTFTITTGHQLNIFTGPLYFIYKIVTVINTCAQLRKQYPENTFVPVYWMASEDHDYEEISYFKLYGKKYSWKTDQTGAVGKFNPKSIKALLNEIPGDITTFKEAYLKHNTLSEAVRYYIHEFFGDVGLVVVDADEPTLKSSLGNIIKEDLFDHTVKKLVDTEDSKLAQLGYHTQVHPRDVNFFYLETGKRNRIEKDPSGFSIVNTDLRFSNEEMSALIDRSPEKFSPNVILRPLYQETILPNLAYIGGPAEVVYWLQLKGVFDHFKTPFPFLMPRNFALVMDFPAVRKFEKTGLDLKDLFEEKNYLFNHWVLNNTHHDLSLNKSTTSIETIFESIKLQAARLDQSLGPFVEASRKRTINALDKIEKKMLRSEKRKHSDALKQIENLKDSLFPGGGLQERTDNFLNFYQQNPRFIQQLFETFDPFDFRFHVLKYHD